jgi:hypothetical protein
MNLCSYNSVESEIERFMYNSRESFKWREGERERESERKKRR